MHSYTTRVTQRPLTSIPISKAPTINTAHLLIRKTQLAGCLSQALLLIVWNKRGTGTPE